MAHPFLVSQFKLTQVSEIEKIIQYGIRAVYIDTARGLDAPGATTQSEVNAELDRAIAPVLAKAEKPVPHIPLSDELVVAKRVLLEARGVVQDILSDVRLGRQVEMERLDPVVDKIIQSVLRNPGALTSLGRVKQKDHYTFQHSVNVGVDPSTYSWGNMINGARLEMAREPIVWWSLSAAFIFMFALVLAANLFSDSVQEAFDPRRSAD